MASNSVPLGQAGTGAAFILPGSQAANRLVQTIDYNAQIAAQERALRQQQAALLASDWQKNQLKVDGGLYWQPEFDKRADNLLKKGIKLRQMGINPYRIDPNDPMQAKVAEAFLLEKQAIESDIDVRKAKELALAKEFALLKADPTSFRTRSIQELNDYISRPFTETKNQQVPTLEKAYNPETELYSKVKGQVTPLVTRTILGDDSLMNDKDISAREFDEDATRREVASTLLGTPKGIQYVEDQTGKTLAELNRIPDTLDENIKIITDKYNGDPQLREQFAVQYNITSPEQAKPILQQIANENYQSKKIYNDVIDTAVKRARAGVGNLVDSEKQNLNRFNIAEKLKADKLAQEREARLRAKEDGSGASAQDYEVIQKTFKDKNGRDTVEFDSYVPVNPIAFGTAQVGKAYDVYAGKNSSLDGTGSIEITGVGYATRKGGKKELTVSVVDGKGNEYMMNASDIPLKTRNDKVYRAAMAKLPKPSQNRPTAKKTVSATQIKSLVGKTGYEGYTEKELIDYYKSQGYTVN